MQCKSCGNECIPFDEITYCINNDIVVMFNSSGKIGHISTVEQAIADGLRHWKDKKLLMGMFENKVSPIQELCENVVKKTWDTLRRKYGDRIQIPKNKNGESND